MTYAQDVIRELLPLSPESRAELEVNIALIAETPAVPDLAEVRDTATEKLDQVCRLIVASLQGGVSPAHDAVARRLHALVDGLAIHLLMQPANADTTWATEIIHGEVSRISADSRKCASS